MRRAVAAFALLFVSLGFQPVEARASQAPPADGATALPSFSSPPTDVELRYKRVFPAPLVPCDDDHSATASATENRDLASAILAWLERGDIDDFGPLDHFLIAHPTSRWRTSLLHNLGLLQYQTGHFSAALASWREAWRLGKDATGPESAKVANQVIAQLTILCARLGRTVELRELLAEVNSRPIEWPSELVRHARDGLGMMSTDPGASFRCGPLALGRVLRATRPGSSADPRIEALRSTPCGLPLSRVADLADELEMGYRVARRVGDAPIALPALVHWKAGHFAALVESRRDRHGTLRYHVEDPTFTDDLWVTERALHEEGSGYYMVAEAAPQSEWLPVSREEAGRVWGRGYTWGSDPGGTGDLDTTVGGSAGSGNGEMGGTGGPGPPCPCCAPGDGGGGGGGPSRGLATYSFHAMLVSLRIVDTPVSYRPPVGPEIAFTVTYTQRDSAQMSPPNYANLGPKWTHQYLAFVSDDPVMPGADVTLATRGGGYEDYIYNATTGLYGTQVLSRTILTRLGTPTVTIGYERLYRDGSKERYTVSDGSISKPRKWLLEKVIDPAGNEVVLGYSTIL